MRCSLSPDRFRVLLVGAAKMTRGSLIGAVALGGLVLAGCNQAQEDRAAQQTAEAIHKGNQALKDIGAKAKEGVENVASAAREAGKEAAPRVNDAALTAKVKTALLADKGVSGTAIDVDTKGGVVTLTGQLPDQAQAQKAVEITRAVAGVKAVENRLSTTAKAG